MRFATPLSTDDLEEIADAAYTRDDAVETAAALVAAAEQGGVAHPTDIGYAFLIAAEINDRAGDLAAARRLVERAIEAYGEHGYEHDGFARAYAAELLIRLGETDAGMAELERLRPLLTADPEAPAYLTEALQETGHDELAERWLTGALKELLERQAAQTGGPDEPAVAELTILLFRVLQARHALRHDLGLPHDAHDELAEELESAVEDAFEGALGAAILFWPQAEFDQLLLRWPALTETYGETWEGHRADLERALAELAGAGTSGAVLVAGSVADLARYAEENGGPPTDEEVRDGYTDQLAEESPGISWPPGRNEPCWCGSGVKYKKCCLPRGRG